MPEAYQETTKWADNTPNHIYLLEGDKAIAYIKAKGNKTPFYFNTPWRIDKRGRTFKQLTKNPFGKVKIEPNLIKVNGSKGNIYYVDAETKTCTCPGYIFRGTCKHLSLIP